MKTLTKTFGLSLIFSAFMLMGNVENAQADCLKGDCTTKTVKADSTEAELVDNDTDEFDFDFESPFFFNDKISINIYNQHDELVYSKAFNKEEADNDKELQEMLKKSEFMLSIHNEHYYHTKEEVLASNE